MSDTFSPEQRHQVMSRIRDKNTRPELAVRRYIHGSGLRYSLHAKNLPGKPDMVLRKFKVVVFINGCFWHAHEGCKYFRFPKTNREYWERKINANVARDKQSYDTLRWDGWRVLVVWECELKNGNADARCARLRHEIVATGGVD